MAFTIVSQGTFTQPSGGAVNQTINLPSGADYFRSINLTQMATTQATGRCVMGEWWGGGVMNDNDGLSWTKTNSTNGMNATLFSVNSAPGFTYVRSFPAPQAALTGTTITNANPAVASVTNTYSNGDQVVIYNSVGMQQISGMVFTISSVSGSGFTLLGLDASGFLAGATAFQVRKISPSTPVVPQAYYVTKISQAAQAVITLSQAHTYVVGQAVEFTIPASFGMVQLNNFNLAQNKPAIITATTTYTITVNINSTNFTAFAFPTSASSPTSTLFATVAPAGQQTTFNPTTGVTTGYNFTTVPFHSGLFIPYMLIPAGAQSPGGSASDVIVWQALKAETGMINSPNPS